MDKNVVIFDFDGVIVDSIQIAFSINREAIPGLGFDEWQRWNEGNFFKNFRQEYNDDASHDVFYQKYGSLILDIKPYEGISEVIRTLALTNILAIVSSSSEACMDAYLSKHDLRGSFADILGKETHRSKVDKFRILVEAYGIEPRETLIITDSIGDVKEAAEAGIGSLAVTWGVHDRKRLEEAHPSFIASSPHEILVGVSTIQQQASRAAR